MSDENKMRFCVVMMIVCSIIAIFAIIMAITEFKNEYKDPSIFTYKNHEYINFRLLRGIAHNPDCKFCKKQIN